MKKEGKSPQKEYKIWNKPVGKSGKAFENVCPKKKGLYMIALRKKIKNMKRNKSYPTNIIYQRMYAKIPILDPFLALNQCIVMS